MPSSVLFTKVLVANRGEIALRTVRALHDLGIASVAVYADDDAASPHVQAASAAVALGATGPAAYLDGARLIAIAQAQGCDAVHPGYGFLSERADFARACADAGLRFIGPTPAQLALFGDKVFMATLDARIVALDAATGEVVWSESVADNSSGYYMTLAPLTARGKVMVGVSGGELGIRGFVVALDTETGEEVWRTHTVPSPGEPGSESWQGDAWQTGGAAVWLTGHYDPELGLTYWGTGNPGPWMGDVRPGDNLYSNSVVALNVDTGELVGHHQYHWNGSWDWDEVSTPLLIDVERDGRTFPALVHPGRNGYLWLLERSADAISFVDAWPYVRQDVFINIDPKTGRPTYDPLKKPSTGTQADFCPSLWGGKDWPPAAYNPGTGLLYIPANDNLCGTIEGQEVVYRPGRSFVGARTGLNVWPGADHIGELQAWNMNTGEKVWTREFDSPNWGPVMTTAGNLVFMGGTSDRYFRAFDARTGDQLWQQRTNSGVIGVPSSYMVDGVQYIAVQSGFGVDAASMRRRVDSDRGTETYVPQGGVIWVFALGG